MDSVIVILGVGFTGRRVASSLLRRGVPVVAGVRNTQGVGDLLLRGMSVVPLCLDRPATPLDPALYPRNATLLHSIPPLPSQENDALRHLIAQIAPRRVVYISATSVYGDQLDVSEASAVAPAEPRGLARVEEERWIAAHAWSTLILRPAAIYGPGRGVHTSLREGRIPRGSASGIVSRIHVDDLAALAEAALFSDLTGAWPVADQHPCSTAEIVDWYSQEFDGGAFKPMRQDFSIHGRRVDGTAIWRKLGAEIKYPSWQTGLPASIAEEGYLDSIK